MKKRKIWKYFTIIYTKHKCQLSNPRNCGKKKFDWPKISKTSQIALGEKIFRKKNSRNYPRFHAGHVRKKLWSHFM